MEFKKAPKIKRPPICRSTDCYHCVYIRQIEEERAGLVTKLKAIVDKLEKDYQCINCHGLDGTLDGSDECDCYLREVRTELRGLLGVLEDKS